MRVPFPTPTFRGPTPLAVFRRPAVSQVFRGVRGRPVASGLATTVEFGRQRRRYLRTWGLCRFRPQVRIERNQQFLRGDRAVSWRSSWVPTRLRELGHLHPTCGRHSDTSSMPDGLRAKHSGRPISDRWVRPGADSQPPPCRQFLVRREMPTLVPRSKGCAVRDRAQREAHAAADRAMIPAYRRATRPQCWMFIMLSHSRAGSATRLSTTSPCFAHSATGGIM